MFELDVCGGLPTGFAANTKVNTAVTRQRSGLFLASLASHGSLVGYSEPCGGRSLGELASGDEGSDSATAGSRGVFPVVLQNVFLDCDARGSTSEVTVLGAGVEYEVCVGHLEFIYLVLS